jgi:hypothetical protein
VSSASMGQAFALGTMWINGLQVTAAWASLPADQWVHVHMQATTPFTDDITLMARGGGSSKLKGKLAEVRPRLSLLAQRKTLGVGCLPGGCGLRSRTPHAPGQNCPHICIQSNPGGLPRSHGVQRRNKSRIVTVWISGGRSLTRPSRDARRFPSTRWYLVLTSTRTPRKFGICPSSKEHFRRTSPTVRYATFAPLYGGRSPTRHPHTARAHLTCELTHKQVYLWTRALSAFEFERIVAGFDSSAPGGALAAYYPLEEGTGTMVADRTGQVSHPISRHPF